MLRSSKAALLLLLATACMQSTRTAPDPRVGLKAGDADAGEAIGNLKLMTNVRSPARFDSATHSDLAFTGKYAIQGNYNGILVYDISNPAAPKLVTSFYCPASQNDVSVYKNLMFVSSEGTHGRLDCGGTLGNFDGEGTCSFTADPGFSAFLQGKGIGAPDLQDSYSLTMSGFL